MPTSDLVIGAVRRDAETTPAADGVSHPLFSNDKGRLKVSSTVADVGTVTGNITGNGQTVTMDTSRVSNVVVEVNAGTFAGVSLIFETSLDGVSNWKAERGLRSDSSGTIESVAGPLGAAPAYRWEFSVNGMAAFRVRSTAWTSGSAPIVISGGAMPTEPFVVVPTHAVTGSGNFAVTMAASATGSPAKAEDAAHTSGDVGVFALAIRNDDAATGRSSANGDYDGISVDANGAQFVRDKPANGSAITTVASSATVVTLLAAAASRRGATIFNESTAILYVALAAGASLTAYTVQVAPGGYYEVPYGYAGIITGIWAAANGNARVTAVS